MTRYAEAQAAARELDALSLRSLDGWLSPHPAAPTRPAWDGAWARLRAALALEAGGQRWTDEDREAAVYYAERT